MLEIRLLGTFDLRQAGKPIALSSRPAQSLFAYLSLNAGTANRREKLAGMIWPDSSEETARNNLRHALWRVRTALKTASAVRFLLTNDLTISFAKSSEYWLDTNEVEEISENANVQELTTALASYQGELLPGFYDEWVFLEREHLSALYEHHMARLMALLQVESRWLDILEWGERWIKIGRTPEPAYRALMLAHAAKGEMPKVATTYERCRKSLGEYGIEPSEQTRVLYENLKAGREKFAEQLPGFPRAGSIRTQAVRLTNLPIPLTSFIGREDQVKEIVNLVHKNRLLTLTGSGGVGKTRLATESARRVLSEFGDGVWWVDFVGLNDPSLLPQAIAQAVGMNEDPNQSLTDSLIEHFRKKQVLLVLDNCEHLISACAQLASQLLAGCPNLTVLTTSREALDIMGETVFSVPSLTLPEIHTPVPAKSLDRYESVRLFVERAASVQPGFGLSDQNAQFIVQICLRLGGIPLALELAAARVKMMSVDEVANRLDDRFALLTTGSRTVLPRHQTLKATIDWSYNLLSEQERLFLQRLSVFVGGFTLRTAEEVTVARGVETSEVIDLLGRLINKSLVAVDTHSEQTFVETRYGILESIREYALEKLDDSGEGDEIRDQHLVFFMQLAEKAQPEIFLSSQMVWFDLLERELDNLRAAMEWSLTNEETEIENRGVGRQEAGFRLAAALAWFWERGYRREATERLQPMLLKIEKLETSPVHTMMFSAVGFLYWSTGEFKKARSYLENAVSTGRTFGKSLQLAWALNYLGATASAQGDQQTAQSSLDEAFDMATGLGPQGKHIIGWALAFLGDIEVSHHEFGKAQSLYEISILALGEIGNLNMKAYPLRRLGYLALYHEDLKNAKKFFKDSLLLNHQLKHRLGTISSVAAFAALALAEENYPCSATLFGAVESHLEASFQQMLQSDGLEYSHFVTLLKDQLDDQAFKLAWNEGKGMSLGQAVEFALAPKQENAD